MSGISFVITEHAPKNRKKTHHPLGGMPLKFVGVDGEGFTDADGVHRYKLLGVGQDQISNKRGLGFAEILEFLYEHNEKGTVFCGFFLGYDFTQCFKNLPEERARMLLTIEGRASRKRRVTGKHSVAPHPVEYDGWQFDMLGSKRLRIRPKRCSCSIQSCPCKPKAPWMYVCDTGGFFQTSFLSVINPAKWPEPIVTDEEYATILEGKSKRATAELDADAARYNRLENEILARVLEKYSEGLDAIGVRLTPSKWFGPGQAAQEWMRGRAPKREVVEEVVPQYVRDAAMASYFGGWFEIMAHGLVPGDSYEYDINSAYPSTIANLPCLLHAGYTRGHGKPPAQSDGSYTLVRARVWSQSYSERTRKHYIGAMPHRDPGGRISRPLITEGWYWLDELEAAQKAKCVTRITGDRWYEWITITPGECPYECNPYPMKEVAQLYRQRLAVGKNTPFGLACKPVYNSMYGKFAQSVGMPLYGNAVYASRITSECRSKILNAIATHPEGKKDVLMVATDAVFFKHPHRTLRCSEDLGEWSATERHNLTIYKPGVYWDDTTRGQIAQGDNPTFKARGIQASAFADEIGRIDAQFRAWNGDVPSSDGIPKSKGQCAWPMVSYRPSFVMTTALQALLQHEWDRAGLVRQGEDVQPVIQSANPADKRCEVYYDADMGIYRSEPKFFGEGSGMRIVKVNGVFESKLVCESTAYEKRFGDEDPFSDEMKERHGITPEGYVGDVFRDMLYARPDHVSPGQRPADAGTPPVTL
jgi:hypothetical protein